MTEQEFLELVNLVEFESNSLDNFELEDKEKDKSIRKSLKVLKTFCIYPRTEIDFFYNFFCLGLPKPSKKTNLTVAATSNKRAANPLESRKTIVCGIFIIFI